MLVRRLPEGYAIVTNWLTKADRKVALPVRTSN